MLLTGLSVWGAHATTIGVFTLAAATFAWLGTRMPTGLPRAVVVISSDGLARSIAAPKESISFIARGVVPTGLITLAPKRQSHSRHTARR